jgi:hypothetical protein
VCQPLRGDLKITGAATLTIVILAGFADFDGGTHSFRPGRMLPTTGSSHIISGKAGSATSPTTRVR